VASAATTLYGVAVKRRWLLVAGAVVILVAAMVGLNLYAQRDGGGGEPPAPLVARPITFADIVPAPAEAVSAEGVTFTLEPGVAIVTSPGSDDAARVGAYLAELVGGAAPREGDDPAPGGIALVVDSSISGSEAYQLEVAADGITIRSGGGAGLFWGVQTLRQLLPAAITGQVSVPGGRIVDEPRLAYRGVMLDVARHFFPVAEVQRLIDLAAMYKVNHLHLHLSDDQGWRIAVTTWPRLTSYGGATQVGGGDGGFYTQDDYRAIVEYAASRFMTVVPEIDLPGHTNAALASYAELNCDGEAPPPYTGIQVGFSALCPGQEVTYRFLDDVFGELAAITPGPYLHIGGDEAQDLSAAEYAEVVNRAQEIVAQHGKVAIGWHDIAAAGPASSTVLQYWATDSSAPAVVAAAREGNRVIMSPADRAYLDQKYDASDTLGLSWAGPTTVAASYDWDPATYLSDLPASALFGVEAPLWTETVTTMDDIEYLVFPRLAGIAEIGWSPQEAHDWPAFRERLGAQAPRWTALGVDFAPVTEVPWVVQ
jgi:N-acetyl-beta-hexosaminidase